MKLLLCFFCSLKMANALVPLVPRATRARQQLTTRRRGAVLDVFENSGSLWLAETGAGQDDPVLIGLATASFVMLAIITASVIYLTVADGLEKNKLRNPKKERQPKTKLPTMRDLKDTSDPNADDDPTEAGNRKTRRIAKKMKKMKNARPNGDSDAFTF